MRPLQRYVRGLLIPVEGMKILAQQRRLWPYAMIPYILAFGFSFLAFYWISKSPIIFEMFNTPIQESGGWHYLRQIASSLAAVIAIITVLIATLFFLRIVAIPFLSVLAEQALDVFGHRGQPFQLRRWIRETVFLFRVSIIKGLLFISVGIILFIFTFIPGLNLLAVAMSLLLFSFDCFDYAFESKKYGLRQRLSQFQLLLPEIAGLATAHSILFAIPGLSFLFLPATVVGATRVFYESTRSIHDS